LTHPSAYIDEQFFLSFFSFSPLVNRSTPLRICPLSCWA
jgi:hypothetical protein